jgi:putative flippase GtrA
LIDKKSLKFICVGIINTIVGSVIMLLLYNLANMSYWFSSVCNYFITSVLSFFLNKYFTFAVREWTIFMVLSFIAVIAVSYVVAYGIAKPVMAFVLHNSSQKFRENAALLSGVCIFTVLNYLGQRFLVFKEGKRKGENHGE